MTLLLEKAGNGFGPLLDNFTVAIIAVTVAGKFHVYKFIGEQFFEFDYATEHAYRLKGRDIGKRFKRRVDKITPRR